MNKYLSFTKNLGITGAVAVAVSTGVSFIASQITSDGAIISTTSTICQYVSAIGTFMYLHKRDHKDEYTIDGKFDKKRFFSEQLKFNGGLLLIDLLYLAGRPLIQDHFIDEGYSAIKSSAIADGISVASYFTLAFPIAKRSGIIKKDKLEEIIENES